MASLVSRAEQFDEPQDRLTRIAGRLIEAFEADPEHEEGDRCALSFSDSGAEGGMVFFGYDDNVQALTDLLAFVQAASMTMGLRLDIVGLDEDGVTRFDG